MYKAQTQSTSLKERQLDCAENDLCNSGSEGSRLAGPAMWFRSCTSGAATKGRNNGIQMKYHEMSK
jgi:hypothetical protein